MKLINERKHPKLCFAQPGQVVQLRSDALDVLPACYIVCVVSNGKPLFTFNGSNGLYSEKRPLFLVNVETGEAITMPNLSERVVIIPDAEVTIYREPQ